MLEEMAGLCVIFVILVIYFLPSIFALGRDHPNFGAILVVNMFLGWTFLAWVLCLAYAFSYIKGNKDGK